MADLWSLHMLSVVASFAVFFGLDLLNAVNLMLNKSPLHVSQLCLPIWHSRESTSIPLTNPWCTNSNIALPISQFQSSKQPELQTSVVSRWQFKAIHKWSTNILNQSRRTTLHNFSFLLVWNKKQAEPALTILQSWRTTSSTHGLGSASNFEYLSTSYQGAGIHEPKVEHTV